MFVEMDLHSIDMCLRYVFVPTWRILRNEHLSYCIQIFVILLLGVLHASPYGLSMSVCHVLPYELGNPHYPRSLLEHTAATMWTEIIVTHCCNNNLGHNCCLWYRRCICCSLGCSADVNVRDVAWRTPLVFQCTPKSTSFQFFYVFWCL
jgi:hypothetical protein